MILLGVVLRLHMIAVTVDSLGYMVVAAGQGVDYTLLVEDHSLLPGVEEDYNLVLIHMLVWMSIKTLNKIVNIQVTTSTTQPYSTYQ